MDDGLIVAQPKRLTLGADDPSLREGVPSSPQQQRHRQQEQEQLQLLDEEEGSSFDSNPRKMTQFLDDGTNHFYHPYHGHHSLRRKTPERPRGYGAFIEFSHTNTSTGGICSCEQSEVFPKRYELVAESGSEWFGLYQRQRPCCANWLADCLPGWFPCCPLQRRVEFHLRHDALAPRKAEFSTGHTGGPEAQRHAADDPVIVVDLSPTICLPAPCLHGAVSRERALIHKNGRLLGRVVKRGLCRHAAAACCICCAGSGAILRVEPAADNTAAGAFYIPSEGQHCRDLGCWLVAPHACCGGDKDASSQITRGRRGSLQLSPQFLELPILDVDTKEQRASLLVSGDWRKSDHPSCKGCAHLDDDYEVKVELTTSPDRPCSETEAELLLALALYFDDRWLVPHLKHRFGPVTMPKLCVNVCDT